MSQKWMFQYQEKTNNERKNGNGKDKGDANHSMTATGNPKKNATKKD